MIRTQDRHHNYVSVSYSRISTDIVTPTLPGGCLRTMIVSVTDVILDYSMWHLSYRTANVLGRTVCHLHLISRRQPGNKVPLRESAYEAASGPGLVAHIKS